MNNSRLKTPEKWMNIRSNSCRNFHKNGSLTDLLMDSWKEILEISRNKTLEKFLK